MQNIAPEAARDQYDRAHHDALDAAYRADEEAALDAAELDRTRTSWSPLDITRRQAAVVPAFAHRSDGLALLYPGLAHAFVGESETLKSFAALWACRSVYEAGGNILYIDFESSLRTFQKRAEIVRLPLDPARVAYLRPEEPLDTAGPTGRELGKAGDSVRPALVVIDGVTEAYALHGWELNSATDAAHYQDLLLRRPTRVGAATLEVDHTPHGGARAIGSQHKRAGLDGASYLFARGKVGGAGKLSTAHVTVLKDREGEVRGALPDSKTVGTFRVDTSAGESDVGLAPKTYEGELGRDAEMVEEVVAFIRDHPGCSTAELREGVTGRNEEIDKARQYAENESLIRNTGAGNRHRWEAGI